MKDYKLWLSYGMYSYDRLTQLEFGVHEHDIIVQWSYFVKPSQQNYTNIIQQYINVVY